ncbi:MAG TPA: COR domain-containing protein [Streptosporangiaceae bacterium]|nr:COR domain-containing protein [Streptosporangiaceae bacterium]
MTQAAPKPLDSLEIQQFAQSGECDLSKCNLVAIPPKIFELTGLRVLNLYRNPLTTLPPEIGQLTNLQQLDLDDNQLTTLPPEIGQLTGLRVLNLDGNQLTTLPPEISQLTNLRELNLGSNQLTTLPPEIGQLTGLRELNLYTNHLTTLPPEICQLTGLRELNLSNNQLTTLPPEICQLTNLQQLILYRNQLITLAPEICQLANLQYLDVDGNHQLTTLPPEIGQLTNLEHLDLGRNDGNKISALPPEIGQLANLQTLIIGNSQLTALPWQLADLLDSGLNLQLGENPFQGPIAELAKAGSEILAGYLHSLKDGEPQYEAKVMLVGEGEVGKTSLIASLLGEPFEDRRLTTHGIEIRALDLPNPDAGCELKVRAWDFGGQEVYRISHQFFFSENALYLVVWKPREGQEQNEVEGWLRRIRLRVRQNARALIVATHCADGRHPDLDYPSLRRAFPTLVAGNHEVDSKAGSGLDALSQAIGREVLTLPQMGQLLSPQWILARDEILGLAESKPEISYDRFTEICLSHGIGPAETRALAAYLHILGRIIYYGNDEGLRDSVILNPEWLTKAISYVLEDTPTRKAGGILKHARLRQIWLHPEQGPGYPEKYHPYFLRLMEKFDISYRFDDDPYSSLVAQLTPHERPSLAWETEAEPHEGIRRLRLACQLSEPVPGLIAWLTVRHHRAATGRHWRSGVFLRHPISAYASEALIELAAPDLLTVEVRAPSPDYFFNVLRDSIEDLMTRRWPGLNYELLIPCPGYAKDGTRCAAVISMSGLLAYREEGETHYRCMQCRTRHDLAALLTGFPSTELQPELKLIHTAITRVEREVHSGLASVGAQAAETANIMRKVLIAVTTEFGDCPRLFTLTRRNPSGAARLRVDQDHYRLTLWCEHPGHPHPWPNAIYEIAKPKQWILSVAPAATIILKILRLATPVAAAVTGAILTPTQLQHAQAELQLATTLAQVLPEYDPARDPELDSRAQAPLAPAQGQAWRAIRTVIFEHDPTHSFGDLRRVQASSGEFLWVCPDHYSDYDPGLPAIPPP